MGLRKYWRMLFPVAVPSSKAVPPNAPPPTGQPMRITSVALAEATASYDGPLNPFTLPKAPPHSKAAQALAMDSAGDLYQWAASLGGGGLTEGIGFLGYAYLAELAQRPEYRHVAGIWATQATRKWIKLTGDPDKVAQLEAALDRFKIRERFRELGEHDGFFGRGQLFIDLGDRAQELTRPLTLSPAKIPKGAVKNFKVIEPFWSYPGAYESNKPTAADFYSPRAWYVMGDTIHASRLLTVVGREVPDLLKPAYAFGGLSLSQMIKPYVDNWLRTRQSVSDLLHSFSTMVLATNMGTILEGGAADSLVDRATLFTQTRDNRGLMLVNKDTEELSNISTPLGSLDKLQAQAQEQMASVSKIPLVVLLGVTPSGLNASSDGEIRVFYDAVRAYQEQVFRAPLKTVLDVLQLDTLGEIDAEIGFDFIDLWETDEATRATNRKTDADADQVHVDLGAITPGEVRARLSADEEGPYFSVPLASDDDGPL